MVVANWPIRARHLLLLCHKLSYTKRAVDHNPTPFPKCHLFSSLAQANLFEILTVSMESAIDSWVRISRQLFKQRLKRSCFMVLLESSEGRKRTPWMLQQFHLTNFGLRNMAAVVVRKGVGGDPPSPTLPYHHRSYDCGLVCLHGKHILRSIAKICNNDDYNIVIVQ